MYFAPSSVILSIIAIFSCFPSILCIMVPTGKLTPITPAKPTPRLLPLQPYVQPAPVIEYSNSNPEPPPLDPSYQPVTYKYLQYLHPNHIAYVPMKIKYPDNSKYYYYLSKYPQKYNSEYPQKYNTDYPQKYNTDYPQKYNPDYPQKYNTDYPQKYNIEYPQKYNSIPQKLSPFVKKPYFNNPYNKKY